jgi:hypothetical protein
MNYDKHPTTLRNSPEEYAAYAKSLDEDIPGWFNDDTTKMAGQLAVEALKRRMVVTDTKDTEKPARDGVRRLLRRATVVHMKPSDTLIISNIGDVDQGEMTRLHTWFRSKKIDVVLFADDVNVTVVSKDEGEPNG